MHIEFRWGQIEQEQHQEDAHRIQMGTDQAGTTLGGCTHNSDGDRSSRNNIRRMHIEFRRDRLSRDELWSAVTGVVTQKPSRMKGSQYTLRNFTLVSTDVTRYRHVLIFFFLSVHTLYKENPKRRRSS
jgi:hypothetical protein